VSASYYSDDLVTLRREMSGINVTLTAAERKTIIEALRGMRDRKRSYRSHLRATQPNNAATARDVTAATLRVETLLVRMIAIDRGQLCPDLCPACGGTCSVCDPRSTCPGVHLATPVGAPR
jgi:hypothetical protein